MDCFVAVLLAMTMKKILIIALVAAGIFAVWAIMGVKSSAESRGLAVLKAMGMPDATIGSVDMNGGYVFLRDIKLDKDGFSTIGEIKAKATTADIMMKKPLKNLTVSRLLLTGAIDENGKNDISGWDGKIPTEFPADEIAFESAQVDLMTPAGAIRLESKAVFSRTPEGPVKFNATVWGTQYQLKLDAAVQGVFVSPTNWQVEMTVNDGRINLENEQASRLNGWITIDARGFPVVLVGGQIDAGNVLIGETSLSAATLTLDASLPNYSAILKAQATRYENMSVALDIEKKSGEETMIDSSVTSPNIDDALTFLEDIQRTANGKNIMNSPVLTPLMITDGNISRVRKDIADAPHDTLTLQIHGPFSDLSGKIIAQRENEGVIENRVISLNPVD